MGMGWQRCFSVLPLWLLNEYSIIKLCVTFNLCDLGGRAEISAFWLIGSLALNLGHAHAHHHPNTRLTPTHPQQQKSSLIFGLLLLPILIESLLRTSPSNKRILRPLPPLTYQQCSRHFQQEQP